MSNLALGIERLLDMTVQRLHNPDPGHHRRTTVRYHHQRSDRGLPFRQVRVLRNAWKSGNPSPLMTTASPSIRNDVSLMAERRINEGREVIRPVVAVTREGADAHAARRSTAGSRRA
jgi:hypothetical protein